ncbi:MAG: 3-dehydroquinate synthase [Fimbriimonas sp.]
MIRVRHHRGEYPVRTTSREELLQDLPANSYVITDANVDAALNPQGLKLVLPPGERTKGLASYGRCLSWLADQRASRRATIVALGGGVIGDLGGFVAATYMRGVRFLQIPTTLLAQVDSSVGGKVGVDLPEGKNLAGAFLAPSEVRLCPEVLRSLPPRQFANGMGEVWKYGLILDADFFGALVRDPLHAEHPELGEAVARCVRLKADVVEQDEFETTGLRAILNYGHTVGHALETVLGYEDLLHGEAIAIGMIVEARLGERLGLTPPGTAETVRDAVRLSGLPTEHPAVADVDAMVSAMRKDKKASETGLAFSLLTQIGQCKLVEGVDEGAVREVLQER